MSGSWIVFGEEIRILIFSICTLSGALYWVKAFAMDVFGRVA